MKICPKCSYQVADEFRFCINCGCELSAAPSVEEFAADSGEETVRASSLDKLAASFSVDKIENMESSFELPVSDLPVSEETMPVKVPTPAEEPQPVTVPDPQPEADLTPKEQLEAWIGENGIWPDAAALLVLDADSLEPDVIGLTANGEFTVAYKNDADGLRSFLYFGKDQASAVEAVKQALLSANEAYAIRNALPTRYEPAPAEIEQPEAPAVIDPPRTIAELEVWYKAQGLPPYEETRFFIGDTKELSVYGIREVNGQFEVFRNKHDGTTRTYYLGPDEANAVSGFYNTLRQRLGLGDTAGLQARTSIDQPSH